MKQKILVLLLMPLFALGLSAQTHFPVYSPGYANPQKVDTDSFETLVAQWDTALNQVQQQVNSNNQNFQVFTNYYQNYIDSLKTAFVQLAQTGGVNLSNVANYMNSKKQALQSLYNGFVNIQNNYPDSNLKTPLTPNLAPVNNPPTCNASCTNMDFSDDNFTGWYGYYATDASTTNYKITGVTGGALGAVQKGAMSSPGDYQIHLTSAANNDWFLKNYHGINMSQSSPWGSGHSAMIGDSVNKGGLVAILSQKFEVTNLTNSITYAYSVFLENPSHTYYEQPFFSVTLFDQNGDTIKNCGEYDVVSGPGLAGFTGEYYSPRSDTIYWRNWTLVNVPLNNYVGQCVTIQFEVSDCEPSGHSGYAYVDASCGQFAITASAPAICGNNGSLTLTGPAGESSYAWSGPSNGILTNDTLQSVTVDSAGKYRLIITPVTGNLCKDTLYYTVIKDTISAKATPSNIKCNGGVGSILAAESNGTGPFAYAWTPIGGNNSNATGLSAGSYTVTVTDANGCSATASASITQPALLTASITGSTNLLCGGGNTGSATAVAGGGTPGYNYLWTPGGNTNANATGLTAGSYTITVTDNNGCTATASVTITQPPVVTATMGVPTNVLCNGGTGSATVTAGGGTPAYAYNWTPSGGTNATGTGLTAGTYTVKVTDNNGCTATASVTITQPPILTATMGAPTNVLCNGGSNGSANVVAGGGTSAYTYSWSPVGGTNANATGLTAGNYTVTVTDKNGCTATAKATITQPTILTATMGAATNVLCNGGTGSATVTAGGGTPAYLYNWAPSGGTNALGTGLTAGSYTVTITDSHGCTATASVTITQPPILTATMGAPTNVLCNGGTGSVTVTAGGGTPGYVYLWSPGANTNANATGLSAGSYTVTITDNNGCTTTASVTITQPIVLTASIGAVTNVSCNGGANASANANANGGTSPYTYAWTPVGGTNANATGLTAGSYTVTITDNHGCTTSVSVTITQPTPLVVNIVANSHKVCHGSNNGNAQANPSGGTPGYNYLWNNGSTKAQTGPVSAGTYTVTVTDNNGCTATASISLTQPPALTVTLGSPTNLLCNGNNTGSDTAYAAGGTPAYTYSWSPGGNTSAIITGLSAGNYTVTVTDSCGETATAMVTITQPTLLTASIGSISNVSCNGGNNASATVTAGGGVSPYTYAWTPVGGTNANATGLSAGSYTVTVKDNNGCTATASITITQPISALSATIGAVTNVSCNAGNNATADVIAAGGTGPYAYVWTPVGGTNANATGLSAGSYTVTITDSHGCTATASVTITQPVSALSATIGAVTNVSCNAGNNATADVNAAGGTGPYAYVWTPVGGTNANATGLSAGSYTVTVTDSHGCTATASVTITQPVSALSATIGAVTNVSCNAGNNATADVNAAGGTGPYAYVWTPVGGTNANATGLSAGSYAVTVTDSHGCTATASVTITQPISALSATIGAVTNVSCNAGNNASATANVNGGTGPYAYVWTPVGGTNANATGLSAGSYTVTITDSHGCTATASVTITQPISALSATIGAVTNVSCNAGNNATADVNAAGGTGPYAYSWAPNGGTNANATGLSAGSYTVTITDSHGCTATASVTITQPVSALSATIGAVTNVSCNAGNNATADVNAAGGTGPYAYSWTPNGGTNANATGLSAGSYTVTVTDSHGCTATASVTITQPISALSAAIGAVTNVSCNAGSNATADVNAAGGTGPYAYVWTPVGGTNANATGLSAGSYTVTVTDSHGCTASNSVVITQPSLLISNIITINDVPCNGGVGNATVNAGGGTPGYIYSWAPNGGTNAMGTGLSAGSYTVTVTDNNGCTTTANAIISQPAILTATMGAPNNVLCNGGTGSAKVTAGGGTPAYLYNWAPSGGTNATGTGLSAGSYTVTVTDNHGCTATASVTITQPTPLTATTSFTQASCGKDNGTATVVVGGGTPGYAYLWTPAGGTNATATDLFAASYTVTITDNNGCTLTAAVTVTEPTSLVVSISGNTPVSCNGGNNGTATANPNGGNSPYTYSWSPNGGTNITGTGLMAGTYTVLVKDSNGCTASASVNITQPTLVVANISATDNVLCNGGTGSATVTAGGGTPGYAYLWAPIGGTNATGTGLTAGGYTVTVTDNNGCTATTNVTITQPAILTATMGAISNVLCNGGTGAATVIPGGGTSPYAYNWSPSGGIGATGTGLTAGSYTVTITDNNGCTATANATVTQPTILTATMGVPTDVLCNGGVGSATVTAGGGTSPYTYAWSPVGGNNAMGTGLSAGSYTVTVKDNNGCSTTAGVTITQPVVLSTTLTANNITCYQANNGSITATPAGGTAPYIYHWCNGQTNITATGLAIGTYTVNIKDANGCSVSASDVITQPNLLTVSEDGPDLDCVGASITLVSRVSGGTAPYAYNWSPSGGTNATDVVMPLANTTYTLTVTDVNGCSASADNLTVTMRAPLSLTVSGDTSVCPETQVILTATGGGGDGTYNYLWVPGNQTTQTITFTPTKDTIVTVELTDDCGSSMVSLRVPVSVQTFPDLGMTGDVLKGCVPLCIQFRSHGPATGISQWNWNFGNGDSAMEKSPIYCYKDTGAFSVSLTEVSNLGCSKTLKVVDMVNVYPVPKANFMYAPNPISSLDPEVYFTDQSTGKYPIIERYWNFGQGDSTSYLTNPTHYYSDTGIFCPTLIVMDEHGCMDSVTNCLDVVPLFTFYIPDAFTPNGDGINDLFSPKGSNIKDYDMMIFDRWGMKLYETTDINKGWDGTAHGSSAIVQEDVYIYSIRVTDTQGIEHTYSGRVTLLK